MAAGGGRGLGSGPGSPTVRRRALAAALRRLRHAASLNLEDAAAALEVSAPTISRYETGIRIPRARDVRELCRLYGADDVETDRLVSLVSGAKESGWWESYSELEVIDNYADFIGLETSASAIDEYANVLVPGLLQTPRYARAVYQDVISPRLTRALSEHDVMKLVEIRMNRQRRLMLGSGLSLSVVIEQVALQRPIGGLAVMAEQISHLVDISNQSSVSVQVLAHAVGSHPGQAGGFTVLTVQLEGVADVVYFESASAGVFLEEPEVVGNYRRVFRTLRELAMSEADTIAWLRERVMESTR